MLSFLCRSACSNLRNRCDIYWCIRAHARVHIESMAHDTFTASNSPLPHPVHILPFMVVAWWWRAACIYIHREPMCCDVLRGTKRKNLSARLTCNRVADFCSVGSSRMQQQCQYKKKRQCKVPTFPWPSSDDAFGALS